MFWNAIKSFWINRVLPILKTLFTFSVLGKLFLVVATLTLFRYLFLVNCLSLGSIKECVTTNIDETGTLFSVGSILIAIVVLVPTFWIDSKIRDAKKEVSREVVEDLQGKMQNLNRAQLLIFEADKSQDPADLLFKEGLILTAVNLWPSFKDEEYRKLSSAYSEAVIGAFYSGLGSQTLPRQRELLNSYINRAIFYLEEAGLPDKNADRDSLVHLACMYGCAIRYDEMIRVIERAIIVNENARDDFQESKRLSLLVRACGPDRRKIEKLGRKIGKVIPMLKDEFIQIIQGADTTKYIQFFGMRRQQGSGEPMYLINTTAVDEQGSRRVTGLYMSMFGSTTGTDIPSEANKTVTIEEFFDEVDKELFVICYKES